MPISAYSTTAGSNTSVAGINIAEGCPAANVNNGMRAQMADTRSFYEAATWTDLGHTPTRTGATTFTVVGDLTAYYVVGRRIRCTDSSTLYGTISNSSYGAPNTTVTVTLDSGSLSVSLTAVAVSIIDPTGDPIGTAALTGNGVFSDSVFRVQDNSDATKQLAFEVSGVTTGTTRTLTVPDVNGTLPVIQTANLSIPATAAGPSSITLAEDTDNGVNTATIIAPAALASNRTYTLPDATGTFLLDSAQAKTMTVLTSGTSWSVPANVTQVKYRMAGGGGGGGGSNATNFQASGGGGGEYAEGYLTVTAGGTVSYAIGAAGSAGASGSNGGNGGTTTLDAINAAGGSAGLARTAGNTGVAGGAGGTGGSGTAGVRIAGQDGDPSITNATVGHYQGGNGGNSQLGAGGRLPALFSGTATGNAGKAYGGGGSGGFGATGAGGAGAAGVIILEY